MQNLFTEVLIFPPKAYANRPSWKDVLYSIHESFNEKKEDIYLQAEHLIEHLQNANSFGFSKKEDELFSEKALHQITENILQQADTDWGGFGKAPKFPQTFSIQFLLRDYYFTKNKNALDQALLSLDKMILGGIYDQIGGGFARYSTDRKWLAPHFEKMLYDNALLIAVLSDAYAITKRGLYKKAIEETVQFLEREMRDVYGGFYSALDADSEGIEGKFYTWHKDEIVKILGNDAAIFCATYDVSEQGNWEHSNILWLPNDMNEIAKQFSVSLEVLENILELCREKLLNERKKRVRPNTDDKVLLSWNAMLITALCKGFSVLGNSNYIALAEECYSFLGNNMFDKERNVWLHTWKNNKGKIEAFLDDYACLIEACIHLQEVTGNLNYFHNAKTIAEFTIENFSDETATFFYFTNKKQNDIIVRKKEIYDGATPSGNSLMANNLLYLSVVFDKADWRERAIAMLQSLGNTIIRYPTSFGVWCNALQKFVRGINEIVVVGNDAKALSHQVLSTFIPNKILMLSEKENNEYPLLANKNVPLNKTFIYLCKDYACRQPFENIDELMNQVSYE
ncbi:MAG: thioredoxin domain-containing protein [Arachidicoccus sp.]|nr:thioredoxin domain-containing protein [Arachidicoccus sp.]